jgi:subtilisin family serine protease
VDLNKNFTELADDALATYAASVLAAFTAIAEAEAPSEAQVAEAEGYADHLDAIATEQGARVERAEALAARTSALRTRFAKDDPEPEPEEEEDDEELKSATPEEEKELSEEAQRISSTPPPESQARSGVQTLARRVKRPAKPAATRNPVTITAAADVPDFATGSKMSNLDAVSTALVNRMRGFGAPSGDGVGEDLRHAGVASFRLDFPAELTIDRHSDDMEVLTHASKETRLPGGSLVAAGGWCAPSETLYDLCAGETTEGILSIPEVNVSRGGIKYTRGPDFSAIYTAVGFCQTEAQAISGTAKTCVTVPCPPFVEVRLDACGLCIKAPILTNAAYPELIQRWVSGALVAHQHKMNAKVIQAIATGSTAKTSVGLGAVATDTLDALTLYGDQLKQKYRLSLNSSLEVVVPFWVKDAIKTDIARRNAIATEVVTDAVVAAHFAAFNLNVQYVYDVQELPYVDGTAPVTDADKWPTTFDALMYPAGTWVKGTADVINLNAVYDAAELATNTYTALFFEQGILTAQLCYDSYKVTLPVCTAGRSGSANLVCT